MAFGYFCSVSFFNVGWEIIYTHGGTILIHKLDLGFGFALVYLFIASGIFCGEGVVNTKINTHTPNQPNPFRERNVVSVAVLIIETHVLALSWPSAKTSNITRTTLSGGICPSHKLQTVREINGSQRLLDICTDLVPRNAEL